MVDLEQLTACPICGRTDIPKIIPIQSLSGIRSTYCNCQFCGQIFLNPRMSDEYTQKYYQGQYRNEISQNEEGITEADISLQKKRVKLQGQALKQFCPGFQTVLEIGCSLGYLMAECVMQGATSVVGIEPDKRYHEMQPASLFTLFSDISDLPPRPFDLICMSHVLEHFNHPLEYMRHLIDGYTNESTCIMVEVPNTESNVGSYRIHHPMAFTAFTLKNLFARLDYKPLMLAYHGLTVENPWYLLGIFTRQA